MSFFIWNESYLVGHPVIDRQHKKLTELLSQLAEAMQTGHGAVVLGGILREMVTYTKVHFEYEEKLMEDAGFPGLDVHRAIHQRLESRVTALQDRFLKGETKISVEVLHFLKDWLVEHISARDRDFHDYLKSPAYLSRKP
jgi:hemerythrin